MTIKSLLFTNIDRYRRAMRNLILNGNKVTGSSWFSKKGVELFIIKVR